jgi:leucyl aminopeptidase
LANKARLKTTIILRKELEEKKFGALLAVAQGSRNPPCLAAIEYCPPKFEKTIVLVGKGVTFDAGGINLKTSPGLEDMKADMAGAAAVGATMLAVAQLKPKVRVVGVLPLVENMPSGSAFRPGDIIRAYSGKTVEIGNTDAEGRLILIDAMAWAIEQYRPDTLIDLATLTGACVVALGESIAGLFCPDEDLAQALLSAATRTHERCWRMPLPDDYRKKLKSDLADIRNIGDSRWGGAIAAALFLSEFVEKTAWAHIDIAGPAYAKKGNAYCGPGATGFGVRLICDYIAAL